MWSLNGSDAFFTLEITGFSITGPVTVIATVASFVALVASVTVTLAV